MERVSSNELLHVLYESAIKMSIRDIDGFGWILIGVLIGFIGIMVYLIPRDIERTSRAQEIAKEMGCEYIGSARDLGSVKFLDCNGEIKIIRVKLK